jgi:Ca2+-binding RTX toxin-like protein
MSRTIAILAALAALAIPGAALAQQDRERGTSGTDTFEGTPERDNYHGRAGDDTIAGQAANDKLYGDKGSDEVNGDEGNDRVAGGPGDDTLDGGTENDRVFGGKGVDDISGGDGDDHIFARDHQADTIDCGAGEDTVKADAKDTLTGCENARVRKGKGPKG